MNKKENGNPARNPSPHHRPKTYYLPAATARNICYYRQQGASMGEPLGVETFDYGIISVLHPTGLTFPELEIRRVQADAGFPLTPAAPDRVQRLCYAQKPRQILITSNAGALVFEAE